MSNDDKNARFEAAVDAMAEHRFYDVTIVCTTDDHQAEFWMQKLGQNFKTSDGDSPFPMVIAVSEDWNDPGGAGNGLGTLYAWQKACAFAKANKGGVDLNVLLQEGTISAALYHTAGKGTRMAPLPASENNNKPGVVSELLHGGWKLLDADFVVPDSTRDADNRILLCFAYLIPWFLDIFSAETPISQGLDRLRGSGATNWNLCRIAKGTFERLLGRSSVFTLGRLCLQTRLSC